MKTEFWPYYLSRAILGTLFAFLVFGFTWKALLFAVIVFALFLLYLHSGWFSVDSKNPLFPLRRDARGLLIQRKALIVAIAVGLLVYLFLPQLTRVFDLGVISGNSALSVAILVYFASQFALFARG